MVNNINSFEIKHLLNKLIKYIRSLIKITDTQILEFIVEIEKSLNNIGINSIKGLYESENSIEFDAYSLDDICEKYDSQDIEAAYEEKEGENERSKYLVQSEKFDKHNIKLIKCNHFRKRIYNLSDNDSFSIYSEKDSYSNIVTLPFQLIFNNKGENTQIENKYIYALEFDFRSSKNSLEMQKIYIPFLKSQETQIAGIEQENDYDIGDYVNGSETEILKISDDLIFLFVKAKVNHPCPCLININLVFNDECGSVHMIELDNVNISFQDLFIPLVDEETALKYCYNVIKEKITYSERLNYEHNIIYSCKVLDLPYKSILDYINKYILIFEVSHNKLEGLINNEFSIFEEFDFKHDFLMNKHKQELGSLCNYTGDEDGCIQITYKWFYIQLFPKYHIVFQFSITESVTVIRIYTDLSDVLAHCDCLFDSWLDKGIIN
ncbi:hypothetical protein FG386_000072 [Cryptosporidium ryanae]|uniref:uncharacterized protein n=1 Tax=Cryptosporidium ryanae TaxID=515981 RepID=UPI00351A010C|nr:hypothetical protein FG386_000072 [Cryptosporidium ryanae]